jgi:group II intron reverse transcriptase/maturase
LQEALHAKAKSSPTYRFYLLYDKLYRADILAYAYVCCRANSGAAGVDGQDFSDMESYGLERWLGELSEELRSKSYCPQAVRRAYIPKPDGKQRPLGIPTVKDRVVQIAAVLVLGPIFEADLQPEQYAYRPGRNALDAVRQVKALLDNWHKDVVDADLIGYFDSIPHAELMRSVARRVSDKYMLALIKMWLQMPVEEIDRRGRKHRINRNKAEDCGSPQGCPISPLLSNIYMRRFVLGWKVLGHERRLDAHIVNYADDLVICCRGNAEQAMAAMRNMMEKLKLTVNETKTRVFRIPDESFDFLGYTFGRCYSPRTGNAYIGSYPSRKAVKKLCCAVSELTTRSWTFLSVEQMVNRLNYKVRGWANYFCLGLGPVDQCYRAVDAHVRYRFRQWFKRKHKMRCLEMSRYPDDYLHETLGLVRLKARPLDYSCAKT